MSYTPTDWEIGDVITAEKMNKLEQAVAGGGNVATVRMSAVGYSTSSWLYGFIVYATYDDANSRWVVAQDDYAYWASISGFANEVPSVIPLYLTTLPSSDDVGLFFVENNDAAVTVTGDITATPLYYSWGSYNGNAYRITGDGTISLDNS